MTLFVKWKKVEGGVFVHAWCIRKHSPCLQGACALARKDLSMEIDLEQETGCTCLSR